MSDELPAGSMDLEAELPATAVADPPAAAVEPPADPSQPAQVDAVEVAGKHYIPVAAVQDERAKRQAAEQRTAALEQQLAQNEPILALLRNNPGLLQRQEPQAPASPTEDPEALEAARLMDFYTADGKPDVERGAKHLALVNRQAERITQRSLRPMQQQTQVERANVNYQKALAMKDPNGNPINPQTLSAVWTQVQNDPNGAAILADPQAAAFVAAAAMGLQTLTGPAAVAPALRPPIVSEPAGGSARRASVTELESRVAAERGKNTDQWTTLTKGHQAGRPNTIEE